jgi:hypothetical protein
MCVFFLNHIAQLKLYFNGFHLFSELEIILLPSSPNCYVGPRNLL